MIMGSLERIEGFRTKWPFAARYAQVNGWRMHYVDEGAGDPVLLLHGNPGNAGCAKPPRTSHLRQGGMTS
jgi:hypothetical protein